MRALTIAVVTVATLATAGFASAKEGRISDSEYLAAARCTGLAQGTGEGASGFESYLKDQSKRRPGFISEQAEKARDQAKRSAKLANDTQRGVYVSELSGACASYKAS